MCLFPRLKKAKNSLKLEMIGVTRPFSPPGLPISYGLQRLVFGKEGQSGSVDLAVQGHIVPRADRAFTLNVASKVINPNIGTYYIHEGVGVFTYNCITIYTCMHRILYVYPHTVYCHL